MVLQALWSLRRIAASGPERWWTKARGMCTCSARRKSWGIGLGAGLPVFLGFLKVRLRIA